MNNTLNQEIAHITIPTKASSQNCLRSSFLSSSFPLPSTGFLSKNSHTRDAMRQIADTIMIVMNTGVGNSLTPNFVKVKINALLIKWDKTVGKILPDLIATNANAAPQQN